MASAIASPSRMDEGVTGRNPTTADSVGDPARHSARETAQDPTRERPRWWPDGEPWPPERWQGPPWVRRRRGRDGWSQDPAGGGWDPSWTGPPWAPGWGRRPRGRAFARRLGCLFAAFAVTIVSVGVLILWLLGTAIGAVSGAGRVTEIGAAALVVLVVGLLALGLGVRIVRGIGQPIGDLVDAAGRVEAGDYSVRVPDREPGPPEIRNLSRAFNTMTARLQADEEQRRRLLADVSHELRTPLAVIQGNLEALVDGVYPADAAHLSVILEETAVMARLVEDLRTVVLAEAGVLPLHREPTDLAVLADEVAASFRPTAEAAGVGLTTEVADDLPLLDVDPIRIREVTSNLVANALRYAPRDSAVRLSVREAGRSIELTVHDDGPGIAPELLPYVFDRFAKSSESRGSGLGLAIAKGIVTAHGGAIEAQSAAGTGTTIHFTLPQAQSG
jgi:two-component system sensor histidine kinase BaeS